ncbi:probable bifunctional methylthioribulose-1-phosphate dehydratase/enolase-phosphatase E1 2 isoform X2 [Morus notabilis]|uniref:probable bifunctional methylthioribulose-1-phosphate dehydratase/enolase-phosphatase E1 2 isoform X2 n=1 Tax=Morus notabilis TaxID=981085 RepID=UPI000CED731F|nr:probable bifunctional methylthioribulose-1-phosphate dehydratase/enolase-phosphatase E1 2 isoform X2 [Morus notabilis]
MEVREDQDEERSPEKNMLPPPVGTFPTREKLLKHVRDFALTQGYMVSIKDSAKDRYVTIACDRSGVYRKRLKTGEGMRQRKNNSRLTNCPFEVVGKKDEDSWTLTIKNGEHNHEPSKDTSDHPSCRRFSEEEVLLIREMTSAGKRPRQILKALKQRNPNLVSDSRNVYNIKAKIHREILSGKRMESSSSSPPSSAINDVLRRFMTLEQQPMVLQNGAKVTDTKTLAAELCCRIYSLGWFSVVGGSIAIKVHDESVPKPAQLIIMSPIGVQKERMDAEDMYVLSSDGYILSTPSLNPYPHKPLKCSDILPFMKVFEMCNAGAVVHSLGMQSCIVTMLNPSSKEFRITHMEMIKGIPGHGYHDELVVPIIEDTAHEEGLMEALAEAISAYPKTTAILVRNHGVYIWGESWISAKTQAECYHYLFDAAIKLHQLGLDWSTRSHGPLQNARVSWGCNRNFNRAPKAGAQSSDYVIEPSQRCVLLDIEGTTTPISFFTDVLVPYAHDNVGKHFSSTYDSEETQNDIDFLRSQIENDLEQGIIGALPICPDYLGKELVIASLVANIDAMISADRSVPSLKQLQDHVWRIGFQTNQLVGVLFDDVAEALERWHSLGFNVYIYSSGSRETQQLLFANSNYGDLRKYLCGYFDTSIGAETKMKYIVTSRFCEQWE